MMLVEHAVPRPFQMIRKKTARESCAFAGGFTSRPVSAFAHAPRMPAPGWSPNMPGIRLDHQMVSALASTWG